ncbi:hypothetical protein L7F22_052682 [Adiantum nelumboides]|nr:hypothetical protein [Adiantum nelumboides]
MQTLISPQALPEAQATSLSPLFTRLLEVRTKKQLERLSIECQEAIVSLPESDRPDSYEGLLDVARFCIDDEPGWPDEDKAILLGGHPRIGAKKGTMSSESEKEQKANTSDAEADAKLARLNFIYERRFPSLRYVTYVAGRPRSAIAKELEDMLGESLSKLEPPSNIDPDSPASEAKEWATKNVEPLKQTDEEFQSELNRGLDALFEIAADRANKITEEEYTAPPRTTPFIDENEAFDEPFLTLDKFKALVHSSPLLETFFETDLPSSFYLVPPPPPQESARDALATLAAVAVTGGGGGDATRKRVKGLLGGLWGEVTDRAGKVTGRETRSGPRPAFGREEILRGEEMRAKGAQPTTPAPSAPSADLTDAEESLKMATQRLTDMERSHFVIDEPTAAGEGDAEDEDDDAGEEEEEELGLGMERLDVAEGAEEAKDKDKEIAKDLRTATAQ